MLFKMCSSLKSCLDWLNYFRSSLNRSDFCFCSGTSSKKPAELEVCYINDAAFDDDGVKDDDDDTNDAKEGCSDQAELGQDPEPTQFPRSKSDWEAFRNPNLLSFSKDTPEPRLVSRTSSFSTCCDAAQIECLSLDIG